MRKLLKRGVYLYLLMFVILVIWWRGSSDTMVSTRMLPNTIPIHPSHAILDAITRNPELQIIKILTNESDYVIPSNWRWSESDDQELKKFGTPELTICGGNFQAFSKTFALLRNVTIDPSFGVGHKGGENISDVLNQKEEDEYFKLKLGYFQIPCNATEHVSYTFNSKSHLKTWFEVSVFPKKPESFGRISMWTIAVLRYEYANLYHTMTDFYNAFLLAKTFHLDPDHINILFLDGHPKGALDSTWQYLFKSYIRAGQLQTPITFNNLVWNIMGYDSPLNKHSRDVVPYLEEFRYFFLSRHGVSSKSQLNCEKLTVLFLWRRDYLAHPRNPSGQVSRKVKNEDELIEAVQGLLPGHNVYGVQIDKYPMKKQLLLISKADILIGMHGAGLSHTLFLPKHAALIELYPVYWSTSNQHFKAMAHWRGLHYKQWSNTNSANELPDKFTIVDVNRVTDMTKQLQKLMCTN